VTLHFLFTPVALVPTLLAAATLNAQSATPLTPGTPVERQIAGGGLDHFTLQLAQGEVLDAMAMQNGIDLVLTARGPDGQQVDFMDSPNGTNGPERIWLVAPTSGTYRIDVSPLESKAPAGKYTISIQPVRKATPAEQQVLARERALVHAFGQQDSQGVAGLLDPQVTWVNLMGGRVTRQQLVEGRKSTNPKYEILQTGLRLQSYGDVAIVNGHETLPDSTNGTAQERDFTRTWMKRNGNWMLVASQYTGFTEPTRPAAVPDAQLDQYAGEYRPAPGQSQDPSAQPTVIARDGDRLVLKTESGDVALEPEAPGVFYSRNMRGRIVFSRPAESQSMQALMLGFTSMGRAEVLQKKQ
jgi:hypothetical protein